jgi:hypothetical protein
MSKLQPRVLIPLTVTLVAAILIAALALPAMAAAPKNNPKNIPGNGGGQNGTVLQGAASGSITVANDNESVVLGMPASSVTVDYSLSGTTYTLKSLRISAAIATPPATPVDCGTRIQGTASGSITVTPTSGSAITFGMPADNVEAWYTSADSINTLIGLRIDLAKSTPLPNPRPDNRTEGRVQGAVSGSIVITAANNSTINLAIANDNTTVEYSLSGTTYTLKNVMVNGSSKPGDGTRIKGSASGSITVTAASGAAITFNLSAVRVEVFYTVSNSVNTLLGLKTGNCDKKAGPK